MDELINIASFCNNILVKYGQVVHVCNSIYIKEDKEIMFQIRYRFKDNESFQTYQFIIQNYNFTITDTEVLVNKSVINTLNKEIESRLNRQHVDI